MTESPESSSAASTTLASALVHLSPDPSGQGEIFCIQDCLFATQEAGGVADDTAIATCAAQCTMPGCGTISSATNAVVTCLHDNCFAECLQL